MLIYGSRKIKIDYVWNSFLKVAHSHLHNSQSSDLGKVHKKPPKLTDAEQVALMCCYFNEN